MVVSIGISALFEEEVIVLSGALTLNDAVVIERLVGLLVSGLTAVEEIVFSAATSWPLDLFASGNLTANSSSDFAGAVCLAGSATATCAVVLVAEEDSEAISSEIEFDDLDDRKGS